MKLTQCFLLIAVAGFVFVNGVVEYKEPKLTGVPIEKVVGGRLNGGGQRRWVALPKNWSENNKACGGFVPDKICGTPSCTGECLKEINYAYASCRNNYCLCHNGEYP